MRPSARQHESASRLHFRNNSICKADKLQSSASSHANERAIGAVPHSCNRCGIAIDGRWVHPAFQREHIGYINIRCQFLVLQVPSSHATNWGRHTEGRHTRQSSCCAVVGHSARRTVGKLPEASRRIPTNRIGIGSATRWSCGRSRSSRSRRRSGRNARRRDTAAGARRVDRGHLDINNHAIRQTLNHC